MLRYRVFLFPIILILTLLMAVLHGYTKYIYRYPVPGDNTVGPYTVAPHEGKLILSVCPLPWTNWMINEQVFANCPVNSCVVTSNRSLYTMSDAVLFHPPLPDVINNNWLHRKPVNQRWIWVTHEPPFSYYTNLVGQKPWISAFNWTATYRQDSDVPIRYGTLRPTSLKSPRNYLKVAKSKTKLVA